MAKFLLPFSKTQKSFESFKSFLYQELAMTNLGTRTGVLGRYFPVISLTFQVYFLSAQGAKSYRTKQILFLGVVLFFNAYELAKALYHGLTNSNLKRFYLFDFICTLQSNQILSDFSYAITINFARHHLYL